MERVVRTTDEPKQEGQEDLWNVEQALDHCFPGWRARRMINNSFEGIRRAYRRVCIEWSEQNGGGAPGRGVLVPHKGTKNKRTADKIVLPVSKAIQTIQNLVPEWLNRQMLQMAADLTFAQHQIHGPHVVDADEEEDANDKMES